jgi:hypothetical protein
MMISNDTSTYRKLEEGGPTVGGGLAAVGAAMGRVGEGGAAEGDGTTGSARGRPRQESAS